MTLLLTKASLSRTLITYSSLISIIIKAIADNSAIFSRYQNPLDDIGFSKILSEQRIDGAMVNSFSMLFIPFEKLFIHYSDGSYTCLLVGCFIYYFMTTLFYVCLEKFVSINKGKVNRN